jgi:hypothetical protein
MMPVRAFVLLCLAVTVAACGDDARTPTDIREEGIPTLLVQVSGDLQAGKAGVVLPQPFVVRVLDQNGRGLRGVAVRWEGAGDVLDLTDHVVQHVFTLTDVNGFAAVRFEPHDQGRVEVVASLVHGSIGSVSFVADVAGIVVWIGADSINGFYTSSGTVLRDIAVLVDAPVEWNLDSWWGPNRAHIAATSAPEGGVGFDSGVFGFGSAPSIEREACCFEFVPTVAGVWEFENRITGARGRLIVQPR